MDTNLSETTCGTCGIIFAIPTVFHQERKDTGGDFYCPNGHCLVYRETRMDQLQRRLNHLKQNEACLQDCIKEESQRANAAERRSSAFKGQITRLKKRGSAGICPCCNRSFINMKRHMATKHPDWEQIGLAVVEGGKKGS